MKEDVVKSLGFLGLSKEELNELIEVPRNQSMGDYAFPCFYLAKKLKKNPVEIAKDIASKIKPGKAFEKVGVVGGYVNFFINKKKLSKEIINVILKEGDRYGFNKIGRGEKVIVEMSSPNIAKPFGIGHLRSTIIGNSIANLAASQGYKPIKINYLGDWGTQFGKLVAGYKKIGNLSGLKKDPIKYMLRLYIEGNKKGYEAESREWFRKLESGDKEALKFWKLFKELSLKDFDGVYDSLGVEFDVLSGESKYNKKMVSVLATLKRKKLLEKSEGALIVDLEKYGLGVSLIQKSDGTTLYATRDLAAAIDRYERYGFSRMFYEVGSEQNLHFRQLFKILELMGYKWSGRCTHVSHGLYLDKDGKKFATRKGKTVFMEDVLNETINLAKKEIGKRTKLGKRELEERARNIAIAAIFYGDLKNYRGRDVVFDIKKFLSFEGDTGPYLLYGYARAQSILRKGKYKKQKSFGESAGSVEDYEKNLISELGRFPDVVSSAYGALAPNKVANYSYELAKTFSDFYHNCPVIGSPEEKFRLNLVWAFGQTIKNALNLLGINVVEEM